MTFEGFIYISRYFSLLVLLPIGLGIYYYGNLRLPIRIIFFFCCVCLLMEFYANYTSLMKKQNLIGFNLYSIIEFVFYAVYFNKLRPDCITNFVRNVSIFFIIILFACFGESTTGFSSLIKAIECLVIIGFCLYVLYKMIDELKVPQIETDPNFWVLSGILIYFSSSFFVFLLSNISLKNDQIALIYIWVSHSVFNAIKYLIYGRAIWLEKKIS